MRKTDSASGIFLRKLVGLNSPVKQIMQQQIADKLLILQGNGTGVTELCGYAFKFGIQKRKFVRASFGRFCIGACPKFLH